ncbi:PREDICTED: uncharacterized protein At2g29880-like [Erythranthe guttata]|uniref:uncharacterized protein At2g29880-like n=1 Tax=Erythranthe guttata TaxID=4155 RepID=UPI00064DD5A3|nr:PREDICTED: uncharacterized protein At2g29880-like [Erythranthe guttata]|eukprot:XP_012831768.1 PREDICTED: uncharacterized protein At2g29880-like [Erythranthe guttata]
MEASMSNPVNGVSKGRNAQTRRHWTREEEDGLIAELKEVIARGMKADNAFKGGYLPMLERGLANRFPTANIRGDPHIQSKLQVWKKTYGYIYGMLDTSGFGFNEETMMVVCDDDVWDKYVQVHPEVKKMRYNSYPYYPSWQEIFGKSRATGVNAQGFTEVVQDLLNDRTDVGRSRNHGKLPLPEDISIPLEEEEYCGDALPVSPPMCGGSDTKSKTSGYKKRKVSELTSVVEPIVNMMSTFISDSKEALGDLSKRLGVEHDASMARKKVFDALAAIPGLSMDNQILAANKLVNSTYSMDLFFSMPDDAKFKYVMMLLDGQV